MAGPRGVRRQRAAAVRRSRHRTAGCGPPIEPARSNSIWLGSAARWPPTSSTIRRAAIRSRPTSRGQGPDAPEEELPGCSCPFLDATSGHETYGAGRYLDLEPEDDGTYDLDFNLAYHPSCVYDVRFSCPLTPAENRLPVRIEAGERLPAGYDEGH